MRFMLIARATKNSEAGIPPSPELMSAIGKLSEDMAKTGVLVGTGGLLPSSMGALVQLSNGNITVTDGPFAETKDLIAGYAIVQVNSKEEAVEIGKRFMKIHADILGPSYTADSEIRQLFEQPACVPEFTAEH